MQHEAAERLPVRVRAGSSEKQEGIAFASRTVGGDVQGQFRHHRGWHRNGAPVTGFATDLGEGHGTVWLTTTRPNVISFFNGFTSHTRTPIASFHRGPNQQPIRMSAR